MKILALDTATQKIGWAVTILGKNKTSIKDFGLLSFPKMPFGQMLNSFRKELLSMSDRVKPDYIAVESLHHMLNAKTVKKLAGVIAIVHEVTWEYMSSVPLEMGPSEIRKVLGTNRKNGKLSKRATRLLINKRFGLGLVEKQDNESDAIALGWTCRKLLF